MGLFHLGNCPVFLIVYYMYTLCSVLLRVLFSNLNGNQMAIEKLLLGWTWPHVAESASTLRHFDDKILKNLGAWNMPVPNLFAGSVFFIVDFLYTLLTEKLFLVRQEK